MKKIIIVDDTIELLELSKRLLEKRGYTILTLSDSRGAFALIQKEKPDLVIMDMLMPDKDGAEICKELKNDPALKKIPVILSTGQMLEQSEIASPETIGADDYLMKPFEIEDLLEKINKWLS